MIIRRFLVCLIIEVVFSSSDTSFEKLKQVACFRNPNFTFCSNDGPSDSKVLQIGNEKQTNKMVNWPEHTLTSCKPDCDEREFPHCTIQCKCDYLRPIVQKFCNPPVPFFLNTCRMWAQGCTSIAKAQKRNDLILPPEVSKAVFHSSKIGNKKPKRKQEVREETTKKTSPSPKDLAKGLKLFSSFVRSPIQTAKDLINQQRNLQSSERPKAQAASSSFPVVPSDASYGAGDDAFRKFDGLTDSRGIVHQPRSSSPFTKPGLWSANPDDPHNRDHANKYYYHPASVGVDWLNGQITWGAHWAVPAAQVGGTDGFSAVHFPTIGNFLNIPDDYD